MRRFFRLLSAVAIGLLLFVSIKVERWPFDHR
jgi:hypothetical protein